MTEEEFNAIVSSLTDKNLLEYVSLLLGKVKVAQSGNTENNSCLEFLISYRDASVNSTKNKAYEVVNGYHQQVDKIIADLQRKKQVINASLSKLVKAEDEKKLNLIYDKIKQNSELYHDNNKKIIDNHEQRTRTAIKLESKPEITKTEKQLAAKLRTIINGDSDENVLENLQKKLSEFKTASEGEKRTVYSNYCQVVDLMLEEIKDELVRREQSKKDQNKIPSHNNKKFSPEIKKSTIPLVIIVVGFSSLFFFLYLVYQRRKIIERGGKK